MSRRPPEKRGFYDDQTLGVAIITDNRDNMAQEAQINRNRLDYFFLGHFVKKKCLLFNDRSTKNRVCNFLANQKSKKMHRFYFFFCLFVQHFKIRTLGYIKCHLFQNTHKFPQYINHLDLLLLHVAVPGPGLLPVEGHHVLLPGPAHHGGRLGGEPHPTLHSRGGAGQARLAVGHLQELLQLLLGVLVEEGGARRWPSPGPPAPTVWWPPG